MKWTDWIRDTAEEAGERLGASLAKLLGRAAPSDTVASDAAQELRDALVRHEAELAAIIDKIPKVPTVAATMAVSAARTVLDGVIAGALQGYTDNN